jgi:hypothetical protein
MVTQRYRPGARVTVNLADLAPVSATEVLLDPEAHGDWHPAEIVAVLPDGRYLVRALPLVGALEVPPVDGARLRPA